MSLLLHAIVPADGARAPEGATSVLAGRLVAIASDHDGGRTLGRPEMLAHHELVAELHADHDACLPARFPTLLADGDALKDVLERRETELRAALERVRGRSELAVTALWTHPAQREPVAADTPGRRYLLERQQAQQLRTAASAIADGIERALGADLIDARRRVCPRAGVAVSSAVLVPSARASELAERVLSTEGLPDVRILVNGPWPPYSFVALVLKGE
jgi:hypothetical protein